jgi:hypothetical protein
VDFSMGHKGTRRILGDSRATVHSNRSHPVSKERFFVAAAPMGNRLSVKED